MGHNDTFIPTGKVMVKGLLQLAAIPLASADRGTWGILALDSLPAPYVQPVA
jgi:hypothetical protein